MDFTHPSSNTRPSHNWLTKPLQPQTPSPPPSATTQHDARLSALLASINAWVATNWALVGDAQHLRDKTDTHEESTDARPQADTNSTTDVPIPDGNTRAPHMATTAADDARISALFARIELQVATTKALASSPARIRSSTAAKFGILTPVPTPQSCSSPAASKDGEEILKERENAASKDPAPTSPPTPKTATSTSSNINPPAFKDIRARYSKGENKDEEEEKEEKMRSPDALRVPKDAKMGKVVCGLGLGKRYRLRRG